MKRNGVAFVNLRAEMARRNIGIKDIAEACNYNRDTLARKLAKKSPLNLDEAFEIQQTLFPGQDIRYLFAADTDSETERAG